MNRRISSSECVRGNQLRPLRRVHAVETGRDRRRTTDAHVHFARAGRANHLDDLPAGRAAHDRVVDEHDAASLQDALHRIQLHAHAEMADRLVRLDERPSDVVIADQAHLQRHARTASAYPMRRAHARVRNRHDDIGRRRLFRGQPAAELGPDLVDALAEHIRVGPREIHVLEDAVGRRRRRERVVRLLAVGSDDEHLARLDVADPLGVDQIERAGLRTDDVRVAEPAERQRPEPMRIAHGNQVIFRQEHQRKRALRLRDRFDQRLLRRRRLRSRVKVQQHLGVAGRLEDRSLTHQAVAQLLGVDEVAVVADGDLAVRAVDQDRLRVLEAAFAGGRVADVADGAHARRVAVIVVSLKVSAT